MNRTKGENTMPDPQRPRAPSAQPRFTGRFEAGDYIEWLPLMKLGNKQHSKFQILRIVKHFSTWDKANGAISFECRPVARWPTSATEEFVAALDPIPKDQEWIIWGDEVRFLRHSFAKTQQAKQ